MNLLYNLSPCFSQFRFNIILPSMTISSMWSSSFRLSDQNVAWIYSSHACYMTRPLNSPWFDHPNNSLWSVGTMKLLVMQFPPIFLGQLLSQNSILKPCTKRVYLSLCACVCGFVCMHGYTHTYTYIYSSVMAYIMYVCMYVCVYSNATAYTYTFHLSHRQHDSLYSGTQSYSQIQRK